MARGKDLEINKDLKIKIPKEVVDTFKKEGLIKLDGISSEIEYKIEEGGDKSELVLSWNVKIGKEAEELLLDEVESVLKPYGIPLIQTGWGEKG